MREIKFRVWDKTNNKMLMPIENPAQAITVQILPNGDTDYEFMQYTGLKDKNDKEIYEGDIVKGGAVYYFYKDQIAVVKFGQFEADSSGQEYGSIPVNGWYLDIIVKDEDKDTGYHGEFNTDSLEVIGNIYENPSLLQEGK